MIFNDWSRGFLRVSSTFELILLRNKKKVHILRWFIQEPSKSILFRPQSSHISLNVTFSFEFVSGSFSNPVLHRVISHLFLLRLHHLLGLPRGLFPYGFWRITVFIWSFWLLQECPAHCNPRLLITSTRFVPKLIYRFSCVLMLRTFSRAISYKIFRRLIFSRIISIKISTKTLYLLLYRVFFFFF